MDFPTGWANGQVPNQAPQYGPPRAKKTFVLCFDGTGNKFSNTDGDSNILKIFRMLDASDSTQLHYYQVSTARFAYHLRSFIATRSYRYNIKRRSICLL